MRETTRVRFVGWVRFVGVAALSIHGNRANWARAEGDREKRTGSVSYSRIFKVQTQFTVVYINDERTSQR